MPAPRPATEEDRKYQLLQVQLADLARQDLRPAIAKATELLLEAGTAQRTIEAPLPFSLGQRRFEIVHRGSFTPTGPGSAAIEHFEVHRLSDGSVIAGLVRKQILRLGHDGEQHGWLYEALFYSGLAAELQMPVVVIPRLFGGMVEPGAITMIIEYLPTATRPLVLQWYQQTAMAIGKLGAVTSLKELQHTEWLTPYRLGMTTSTLDSLEALAVRCLADARESGRILTLIEELLGNPRLLGAIRSEAYSCVAHGDIHSRNVIRMHAKHEAVGLIDWGKVCSSIIGQDMALPFLPRYVVSRDWSHAGDFAFAAAAVQDAIFQSVSATGPGFQPERVSLGLDLAIVQLTAVFAERFANSFDESLARDEIRRRELRMAEIFRHAATIIEALNNRFA